jgi:diguanylate cyclase (GGDEF)-like protein
MSPNKETNLWSALAQPQWMFWQIRGIIFLSFIFWMIFTLEYDPRLWALVTFFLVYSLVTFIVTRQFTIVREKLYFFTSLLDIILITFAILVTDRQESGFFFLYFLVVPFGSYAAGLLAGISLALLSTIFYLSINASDFAALPASSVLIKILALWVLSIAVGMVVKEMKYSRSKLLRTFDILNQRTSELEKSQAQIETIYETSRTLGEKLNLNEVVDEILNIVQKILGYGFFSIFVLTEQGMLSLLGEIKKGERYKHGEPKAERLRGVFSEVVNTGKTVRVFDVTREPNIKPNFSEIRSIMAVPMISRGKVIGVMDASSTRTGAFLDQDEKIFSILASSAALAIENALLHQKTEELTIVDELTGLYNYRYFNRKLRAEVRRAERYAQTLSMIMIDIDWFKRCNDTYGHLFGNRVLQELGVRIKDSVREVDVVCRYGGEEFAVILPQTKKADAQMIGERIRHKVESVDFGNIQEKVKMTVSLGVASFPENGRTSKELIEKVDQALYLAKGKGKNLVCTI